MSPSIFFDYMPAARIEQGVVTNTIQYATKTIELNLKDNDRPD
jgi:hypothetical protein